MRSKLTKIAIATLASIVFAPIGAELYLRVFKPVSYRRPVDRDQLDPRVTLVHRRSQTPGLAYELVPGADGDLKAMHVTINALGLRGPEIELHKPAGVRRIAAIGDSVTFGLNVDDEYTWPRVLERLLNEANAARGERWEVLNFGVGGYSSRDEAIVLREKALAFEPDLVIVGYFLNDPMTEPIQPMHQYFHDPELWERSHLLRWIVQQRELREAQRIGKGDVYRAWHAPEGSHWASVPSAFDAMRDAAAPHHVPILVALFPCYRNYDSFTVYPYANLHAQVEATARKRGFATLDLVPAFVAAGKPAKAVRLDPEHPNEIGYEIAARAMLAKIEAERDRFWPPEPAPSSAPATPANR